MPRKVRVVTASAFPAGAPPEDNMEKAIKAVEWAGQWGADLICLPEGFRGDRATVEPLRGPTLNALAEQSRKHSVWVVAGLYACEAGATEGVDNCAVVIDRHGDIAGCYVKVHPTMEECERGVVPGGDPVTVDADFGRIGLAICYDINWPAHWAELARRGAELVVWPSAYDGGLPLSYYAWAHSYHVVSAVRTAYSKVIDISGSVAATTNLWHPLVSTTVDLEQELFHADYNEDKLPTLEAELGPKVTAHCFDEERYFTLESNDPKWPLARVKAHYGLEGMRDYCARASQVQDAHRARAGRVPSGTGSGT